MCACGLSGAVQMCFVYIVSHTLNKFGLAAWTRSNEEKLDSQVEVEELLSVCAELRKTPGWEQLAGITALDWITFAPLLHRVWLEIEIFFMVSTRTHWINYLVSFSRGEGEVSNKALLDRGCIESAFVDFLPDLTVPWSLKTCLLLSALLLTCPIHLHPAAYPWPRWEPMSWCRRTQFHRSQSSTGQCQCEKTF